MVGALKCILQRAGRERVFSKSLPGVDCPERTNSQLHQRIAPTDWCLASPASSPQHDPAQQRNILPPRKRARAGSAMRTRRHHTLACRPAAHANVQKAAERKPQKPGKSCCKNTNHARLEYTGSGLHVSHSSNRIGIFVVPIGSFCFVKIYCAFSSRREESRIAQGGVRRGGRNPGMTFR